MPAITTLGTGNIQLSGLQKINVLLGKNGCGKSRLLRSLDAANHQCATRYITPERSGYLQYQNNIEEQMVRDSDYLRKNRRKNQIGNYKIQSAVLLRRLESAIFKRIEEKIRAGEMTVVSDLIDSRIKQINSLLDNIELRKVDFDLEFYIKESNQKIGAEDISSGESELIALAIDVLHAVETISEDNLFLFIDEPDVHLHPDLQHRFCAFVSRQIKNHNIQVIMATHSSAIVGSLENIKRCTVAFMKPKQEQIEFRETSPIQAKIVPVFGAHPLSNVFNRNRLLLVEGDDDERIWQQAIRSTEGKLRLYPCSVGGKPKLGPFEEEADRLIQAVYDKPVAYSIRDRDGGALKIENKGKITRARLVCRASENLLLTDDVLHSVNITWPQLESLIEEWLTANQLHPKYNHMRQFADSGFDRRNADVKEVRTLLVALMGSNKPWEVLVGKAIAELFVGNGEMGDCALKNFLGKKIRNEILRID